MRSDEFVAGVLRGEHRAIARAISAVENETEIGRAIVQGIHSHLGRAHVLGITGAPGAGKSTLVSELIGEFTRRGKSVGVVAVDPSSPFSGGAILGDRIRMERHSLSERVFIRSLASRGHLGGLSRAVFKVVDVLDAAGFELIIVETVGAGQSEVEIAEIADTRVVVCPPGLGDDVQAIKAGILEIADILVVSKADLPLADKTELDLRFMLSVTKHAPRQPSIVRVSSVSGAGMTELADAIGAMTRGGGGRRGTGSRERMRRLFAQEAGNLLRARLTELDSAALDALCDAAARGEIGHEDAVTDAIRIAMNRGS
ncbi:MAG: methylmalonyl Co-A mutase-associated GTPase MeaB [Betaproteobacteria bacterium]|nr:methylmalonyl Co-A mutase-associated GTPase MeaB [Betaproteobacteria bacterium]